MLRCTGEGEGRHQRVCLALDRAIGAADRIRREIGCDGEQLPAVQQAHLEPFLPFDGRLPPQHLELRGTARDHQTALRIHLQLRRGELGGQFHPTRDAGHHQVERRREAPRPALALVQERLDRDLGVEAAGVVAGGRRVQLALLQQQHVGAAVARQMIGHRAAGEPTPDHHIIRRGFIHHG